MGPEFQSVLELAEQGVPNLNFLFDFYDRKVTFKLLSRKIHNVLALYNIRSLTTRAIGLAHEQLTQMIDKMIRYKEFFYSNDLISVFNEQEQAKILDMIFEEVDNMQEEKDRIFQEGLAEYLLEHRVEQSEVFILGMIITFEMFHQVESQVGNLGIDEIMKEYFSWIISHYMDFQEYESPYEGILKIKFDGLKNHLKNFIQKSKTKNMIPAIKGSEEEASLNKSLMTLFYNSFISFEEVSDEQIKKMLLHTDRFSPLFMESINKCENNETSKQKALETCKKENPNMECILENNFVATTLCPFDTFLVPFTTQCIETCPKGFREDTELPSLCHKPQIQFRSVLDVEHSAVLKHPSAQENHLIQKSVNLNGNVQKTVKREITNVFKKIQKDFAEDELNDTQKSNVFERKFRMSECPLGFEEFDLMCIPVCPEGWVDHGNVCVKPMNTYTRKYIVLPE
jgi:hypothetical protein